MMLQFIEGMSSADLWAISLFFIIWLSFEIITDHSSLRHSGLSGLMAHRRREWMLVLADRELRMVDTSILAGLQQGTAFFASTSILAIGGCFALLGSTDLVSGIYQDLPINSAFSRGLFELKVLGLTFIFVYSFFKFGWAFRLFNYCSILIGAVQQPQQASPEIRRTEAMRAGEMNIIASAHFTAGLRGIFFALGYLGWFIGPYVFVGTTVFILLVLIRRQYFSKARAILVGKV
ncbi:MAG: DUF599 family protein [Salaquimonas sp.]